MVLPSRPAASVASEEADEPPLDPAVERVRQRLKRLMLVSLVTLVLGFAAVAAAVLYKVGPVRDKTVLDPREAEIAAEAALPPSTHILSTALDGRMLAVTFDDKGAVRTWVIDLDSGRVLRRLDLSAPTAAPP